MRMRILLPLLPFTLAGALFVEPVAAQSNLVVDGSFESLRGAAPSGWEFTPGFGALVNEHGAAEGKCWLTSGTFAQNIPTVPGGTYRIRFALSGTSANVKWNGALVAPFSAGGGWNYTNFLVTATGAVSRVGFEVGGWIDDITVGWMEEPPSITRAVPSRSSFVGGAVTFPVVASGAPNLCYQWYVSNDAIAGATNSFLELTNILPAMAGEYGVVISNAFGVAGSLPASLVVRTIPDVPLILNQPKHVQMTEGYGAGFFVFAVGDQPLTYQWRFNGTNITGATNSSCSFYPVSTNNGGAYTVLVSNQFGTVLSFPAILTVQTGMGGGYVDWNNMDPQLLGIDARVFDVDGITPLAGPDFVAQLYAGAVSNNLHAVGQAAALLSGFEAGYFYGLPARIPDVLAYGTAYIQVRVWDKSKWKTFEEAAALGGKVGKSEVIAKQVFPEWQIPPFAELFSFKLNSGSPALATAKLYPNPETSGDNLEWILVGEPDTQYVVESRTPPNDWNPILLVTNTTGAVTFVDTNAQNAWLKFYRAQIINP